MLYRSRRHRHPLRDVVSGMNNYDYDNQPDPGDDPMIDPSDTFDTDQERPVANFDWTKRVPPIPNTYDPREDEEI